MAHLHTAAEIQNDLKRRKGREKGPKKKKKRKRKGGNYDGFSSSCTSFSFAEELVFSRLVLICDRRINKLERKRELEG